MTSPPPHSEFRAIWNRALNETSLKNITPELIRTWSTDRGLNIVEVEERGVGAFAETPGIVLVTDAGSALFPTISANDDPAWLARRQAADREAELWEKVEWFAPFWVERHRVDKLLVDVAHRPKERALELFNYHTSTIYTVAFQAACIAQMMPAARSLKDFVPLAREAYLAFFAGYRAASISALIPLIEGSLTRIVPDGTETASIPERVDRAVGQAIATAADLHFGDVWTPEAYRSTDYLFGQDERVFGFETFRRWLRNSFFRNTGEYDGATWLNRHVFAHGAGTHWQQTGNFSRLVVALATIGLIESWHDRSNAVSVFLREMNEESTLLWQQALFQMQAQVQLKEIEQQRYQKHGRLVPDMPGDDGVLLRQAHLAEDGINDLVRPLRDAGWSVEVSEPDDTGLYMTVVATADGERFGAALLFTCGTANDTYRKLAETCDAILYRGAPYKQESFAYGIDVHVGPVAGWQPPLALHRRSSPAET